MLLSSSFYRLRGRALVTRVVSCDRKSALACSRACKLKRLFFSSICLFYRRRARPFHFTIRGTIVIGIFFFLDRKASTSKLPRNTHRSPSIGSVKLILHLLLRFTIPVFLVTTIIYIFSVIFSFLFVMSSFLLKAKLYGWNTHSGNGIFTVKKRKQYLHLLWDYEILLFKDLYDNHDFKDLWIDIIPAKIQIY